jgi:hypothetical protein
MARPPDEGEIRKAACDIGLRCRRIVEKSLPAEQINRIDWEFSGVAESVIRELTLKKEK